MELSDTYRVAKLLLDQHGQAAKPLAHYRIVEMRRAGNRAAERLWLAVFGALVKLEATRPAPGQRLH